MNDGYYNTRDQNDNGILDYMEDYPIPVVGGLPPGCWPVEPGTPGFEETEFPFACITPLEDAVGNCSTNFPCFCELPAYEIVTNGTCVSAGYTDILEETLCRAVMDDGYYSTRDQNNDGVIDAFEDYMIPVVSGLPPGCWPVEPGTPGFETTEFPFACITPLEDAVGDCSDNFPCFCLTDAEDVPGSDECVDSTSWFRTGQPSQGCDWVAMHEPRCDAKGEDRLLASYACPAACNTTCTDSTSWHKNEEPSKDCAWVSWKPDTRCFTRGPTETPRIEAREACPTACVDYLE